jgi:hypothetical protein
MDGIFNTLSAAIECKYEYVIGLVEECGNLGCLEALEVILICWRGVSFLGEFLVAQFYVY